MLTDITIDIVDNFKEAGCDGFMLIDDWGTQNQSFISPRHFEQFFFSCYQRIVDRCHECGMHCGMHSCGDLKPLVPLMIETGLDYLQLDSPDMCGVDWLSENAAGKVCLWCSVDIQTVYPTNDPEKIERYVEDLILKLGNHNGGLVAWPYSEPAVIEVGEAAVQLERDLFEKLGNYPIAISALR
jgi:uroporphyrinogen-III decarboxylase